MSARGPGPWLETILRDLEYGLRQLRRSPGFALIAILSLALGIGFNTAIFQLIDAVALRSLPVRSPETLAAVKLAGGNRGWGLAPREYDSTNPLFEQISRNQQAFTHLFGWGSADIYYGEGRDSRPIRGVWLAGDPFGTLGIVAHRGRLWTGETDHKGCATGPAVISHGMWLREFGGDERVIGRRIYLERKPFEIVAVTPPEFFGLEVGRNFDVAFPNCARAAWASSLDRRSLWNLFVVGRLKPDWTVERAASHLATASKAWFETVPPGGYDAKHLDTWYRFRLTAEPGGHGVSGLRNEYQRSLWILLGITGLVLAIACANLANLQLARAAARESEIAVRLALGASRQRLVAQLLSESLLLAVAGVALGLIFASRFSRALLRFLDSEGHPLMLDLTPDWRLLLFTTLAGTLTCVLFGLVPALKASRGRRIATARSSTQNRQQFSIQRLLITTQIAISLVLLIGAVLFVQSLRAIQHVSAGFYQDGVIFSSVALGPPWPDRQAIRPMQRETLELVRAIPGIESASTTTHKPLTGSGWTLNLDAPPGAQDSSKFVWAGPGYFRTMGIRLLTGRDFNDFDTEGSAKVLLVNETFARLVFPGADPIGKTVRSLAEPGYPEATYEVIGVVSDTKYDDLRNPFPPIAYGPELQNPEWGPWMSIVVRSSLPAPVTAAALKKTIAERWPASRVLSQFELRGMVNERLVRERMLAWLSGLFGALACLLAMLGLYGVISYMTARRRKEIGIRLALGATRASVTRLVVGQVMVPLAMGSLGGASIAFALAQTVSSLLFGIAPRGVFTFVACSAALGAVVLAASLVPAVRAARLNPVATLRDN